MWTKLDDGILDHPKINAVGVLGFAWFAASLVYCNRNLTDGFIPYGVAQRLLPFDFPDPDRSPDPDKGRVILTASATSGMVGYDPEDVIPKIIRALCEARLWEEDLENGGFWVHDFLDWNLSKQQVLRLRRLRSRAGKRGGRATALASAQASAQAKSQQTITPHPASSTREVQKNKKLLKEHLHASVNASTHKISTNDPEAIGQILPRVVS